MDNFQSNRVAITDLYNGLEITIRAGRAWQDMVSAVVPVAMVVFFTWLDLAKNLQNYGVFAGTLVVLCAGMLLYYSIYRLWWLISGVEIVTVADEVIIIRRKNLLRFNASQNCLLADSKDFTADRESGYWGNRYNTRIMGLRGTVRFNCAGKNCRFGDMLDEDEADQIIWRMRDKKLIN